MNKVTTLLANLSERVGEGVVGGGGRGGGAKGEKRGWAVILWQWTRQETLTSPQCFRDLSELRQM